jgi:hypothetical protein
MPINNPVLETELFWDAHSVPSGTGEYIQTNASGTGATIAILAPTVDGRSSIVTVPTGTTATGRHHVGSTFTAINLGAGETLFGAALQVPILSTAAERFSMQVGFYDTTAANQTDGLYFLYDEGGVSTGSAASANWQIVSAANGVRTFGPIPVAKAVDLNWHNFKIVLNSAGTRGDFYIDGELLGSITTNIPTGFARVVGFGAQILKSIGLTSRSYTVDFLYFKQIFKVARGAW